MPELLEKTIGELVAERPARARAFEAMGIDFCCGGRRSLKIVCSEKGLDLAKVERELAQVDDRDNGADERNWSSAGLTELADHIEESHHAYLKSEFPRLGAWVEKVASRHGGDDPRLVRLAEVFAQFQAELGSHMMKEERILFPLCREMESGNAQAGQSHCGSIANPIRVMFAEHDDAGRALEEMASLTDNFVPPAHACNTYRAMLDGLARLRADMHQHVHKENNILFPKAIELERKMSGAAG